MRKGEILKEKENWLKENWSVNSKNNANGTKIKAKMVQKKKILRVGDYFCKVRENMAFELTWLLKKQLKSLSYELIYREKVKCSATFKKAYLKKIIKAYFLKLKFFGTDKTVFKMFLFMHFRYRLA